MSNFQDVTFLIPKQIDKQLVKAVSQTFTDADFEIVEATFTLLFGGTPISATQSNIGENTELKDIVDRNSQLISTFKYTFFKNNNVDFNILISRKPSEPYDEVVIRLKSGNNTNPPSSPNITKIISLIEAAKTNLKELNYDKQISTILGQEIKDAYAIREAELIRLQSIAETVIEKTTNQAGEQRERLEEEYSKRRDNDWDALEQERKRLEEELSKRRSELDEREKDLNDRLSEIDDRDNRHVRREIRNELKQELAQRNQNFELTQGTQRLRVPIFWFTIILLIFFGSFFALYSWNSLNLLTNGTDLNTQSLIALLVRQLIFSIAFGSTAVFFIRWNNRWHEQHASEEFKLKRLDLDFDRASWVVEMALEWKEEKGTDIPQELINKLTSNIFSDPEKKEALLHPADQLASALFGSSSEASIEIPGVGILKIDRKGIKQLAKMDGVSTNGQ